jgi:hypothetical protein
LRSAHQNDLKTLKTYYFKAKKKILIFSKIFLKNTPTLAVKTHALPHDVFYFDTLVGYLKLVVKHAFSIHAHAQCLYIYIYIYIYKIRLEQRKKKMMTHGNMRCSPTPSFTIIESHKLKTCNS